jgi:hypothetical protein
MATKGKNSDPTNCIGVFFNNSSMLLVIISNHLPWLGYKLNSFIGVYVAKKNIQGLILPAASYIHCRFWNIYPMNNDTLLCF